MSSAAFPVCPKSGPASDPFAAIVEDIAGKGWCVVDDFVPADWVDELLAEQMLQSDGGAFHSAGVGRESAFRLSAQTRGDDILWLDQGHVLPSQQRYLVLLDDLRQAINQGLFLGLCGQETLAARYRPGSFYRRHVDGFQKGNLRVLTVILYLNRHWQVDDGGALRLYLDTRPDGEFLDVLPEAGRLVVFLSESFDHEVLETRRVRWSITSWFSRRPLQ